jgi:hypothetical protein
MYKHFALKTSLIALALLGLPFAQAGTTTKADYQAARARIESDHKADRADCNALAANAKDICVAQATAKEKVARAELEARYSGKTSDQRKVLIVRAETAYAVAKEHCDDQAGNAKDVCVKEAKAVETKALAEARMDQKVDAARKESSADMRAADYAVAIEKCDATAGEAKENCIAAAKSGFGQK